jgi:hypothetical protein
MSMEQWWNDDYQGKTEEKSERKQFVLKPLLSLSPKATL